MLANLIFRDAMEYESLHAIFKNDHKCFDAELQNYEHVFNWYPLQASELVVLPSGFAFDLRQGNNETIGVRLIHLCGHPAFKTECGELLKDVTGPNWYIRLGLSHKMKTQKKHG